MEWEERANDVGTSLPYLNPLDFAFWGLLKTQVYAVKIQDLHHPRQKIADCCATAHPHILSRIHTNIVNAAEKIHRVSG
jgi:hypothetical protein